MGEVAKRTTPLTRAEMVPYFLNAWQTAAGGQPSRSLAELLLALLFVENANGQSLQNFNWGNLSVDPAEPGDYWRPPWFDAAAIAAEPDSARRAHLEDVHAKMVAHQAPQAFRSYDSHETGASQFVGLMLRPRMAPLLAAAEGGDPVAFAHAVHSTAFCSDASCRDGGPTYDRVRAELRAANLLPAGSLPEAPPRKSLGGGSGAGVGLLLGLFAVGLGYVLTRRKGRR